MLGIYVEIYNEWVINDCKINIDIGILVKQVYLMLSFVTVMACVACIFEMYSRPS